MGMLSNISSYCYIAVNEASNLLFGRQASFRIVTSSGKEVLNVTNSESFKDRNQKIETLLDTYLTELNHFSSDSLKLLFDSSGKAIKHFTQLNAEMKKGAEVTNYEQVGLFSLFSTKVFKTENLSNGDIQEMDQTVAMFQGFQKVCEQRRKELLEQEAEQMNLAPIVKRKEIKIQPCVCKIERNFPAELSKITPDSLEENLDEKKVETSVPRKAKRAQIRSLSANSSSVRNY